MDGGGLKFSPILLVEVERDQLIRLNVLTSIRTVRKRNGTTHVRARSPHGPVRLLPAVICHEKERR